MNNSPENLVRALWLIISNIKVYGAGHSVTRQSAQSCFQALQQVWASKDVTLEINDHVLSLNNVAVESRNRLIRTFIEHAEKREMNNFTLKRGMTSEQFMEFIEVLNAKPEELQQLGGIAGALAAVSLDGVAIVRKAVYREITEDEEVIEKQKLLEMEQSVKSGGAGAGAEANVHEVVAFISGDPDAGSIEAAQQVREAVNDAGRLADLILRSAEVKESASLPEQAETLDGIIVGCLRRIYDAMKQDPAFHTQKTKKQIQRALVLLEREVLQKLREKSGDAVESCETAINDAVEEMNDELTIDALAQEYSKKRNAVNSSEKRILRYLKRKGSESAEQSDLKDKLRDGGLDEDNWRELLVKSGVSPDEEADAGEMRGLRGSGGFGAIGDIGAILQKLEQAAGRKGTPAQSDQANESNKPAIELRMPVEVFKKDLENVHAQVGRIVRHAEKTIENLVSEVGGKPGDAKSAAERPGLSRKRLFEILAELGQELCQPLAVINCAIDMMLSGSLGQIGEMQQEMLSTAAESSGIIQGLVNKLISIAGTPKDINVDKSIQKDLRSKAPDETIDRQWNGSMEFTAKVTE